MIHFLVFLLLTIDSRVDANVLKLQSPVTTCTFRPGTGFDYQKRRHPFTGKIHWHSGVDLSARLGSDYLAPADGVITKMGPFNEKCGYIIEIKHAENLYTHSCHMLPNGFPKNLKVGDQVRSGQVVAKIGITGKTQGPHAHFVVKTSQDMESHMDPFKFVDSFCGIPRESARSSGPSNESRQRGQK